MLSLKLGIILVDIFIDIYESSPKDICQAKILLSWFFFIFLDELLHI